MKPMGNPQIAELRDLIETGTRPGIGYQDKTDHRGNTQTDATGSAVQVPKRMKVPQRLIESAKRRLARLEQEEREGQKQAERLKKSPHYTSKEAQADRDARARLREIEAEGKALRNSLPALARRGEQAAEALIEIETKHVYAEASQADVDLAKETVRLAQQAYDEAASRLQVVTKALPRLKEHADVRQAKACKAAEDYAREQLRPLVSRLADKLAEAEALEAEIEGLHDELRCAFPSLRKSWGRAYPFACPVLAEQQPMAMLKRWKERLKQLSFTKAGASTAS